MGSNQNGENRVRVRSQSDGKFNIAIVKDGQEMGCLEADPRIASLIAAQVLHVANVIHSTGAPSSRKGYKPGDNWPYVEAISCALAPCPAPDHECIIFRFGDAELGIATRKEQLKSLGQAMLTMSTDSNIPQ